MSQTILSQVVLTLGHINYTKRTELSSNELYFWNNLFSHRKLPLSSIPNIDAVMGSPKEPEEGNNKSP